MIIALGLMVIGCIFENSKCGDDKKISNAQNEEALLEAAKFRRLEQYDHILLQRKTRKARYMLPFACLRNGVHLNIQGRALRNAMRAEEKIEGVPASSKVTRNLKVFNGLKGFAMLYVIWGQTFFFSWYSVINNPESVKQMRSQTLFNAVTASVYTVPVFFFCSGFLQTFSFTQKDKEESMFSFYKLVNYTVKKFLRYMPLNMVCLLATMFFLPLIGSGPIWNNFETIMAPCQTYWWTNMVWVSNFYPQNYDDKCMPWTWFLPCYV